jgi:hypothetical protein
MIYAVDFAASVDEFVLVLVRRYEWNVFLE